MIIFSLNERKYNNFNGKHFVSVSKISFMLSLNLNIAVQVPLSHADVMTLYAYIIMI